LPRPFAEEVDTISNMKNILIADDNPAIIEVISTILENAGHNIEVAKDGVEALAMAKAVKFDVILLDINMPNMNGIQAQKEMKKYQPNARFIMVTGCDDSEMIQKAIDQGAEMILRKPFKLNTLINKVNENI
jgi:two-component system chemotaxis response regulator CheY